MNMTLSKIQKISDALRSAQDVVVELTTQMEPYEQQIQVLRRELLAELKKSRITTYKSEEGTSYSRVYRSKLVVTSLPEALIWAETFHCLKVDTGKAQSVLKGQGALPVGLGYEETESLRVSSPRGESEVEN